MNLARLLSETAARNPGKPAVVFEGTPCTYGAFDREVERYAAMLHAAGVGKGDRVAVQFPKRMEFLFLHLANLSVGAVTLPLNTDYRPEEVEYFLSDSGTSLFVTDAERFARAAGSIRELRGVRTLLIDPAHRKAKSVGYPLAGVDLRVAREDGGGILRNGEEVGGKGQGRGRGRGPLDRGRAGSLPDSWK